MIEEVKQPPKPLNHEQLWGEHMKDEKTGIVFREGTFDQWILNETRSYFPLGITTNDAILDLGGHIGCFASRAMLEKPFTPLLSIEAEKSNYDILMSNASQFSFSAQHLAVVDDSMDGAPVKLFVNKLKNNALHSVVPVRGRDEQTVTGRGLGRLIGMFGPTIIKCDIEGGEYSLPWEVLGHSTSKVRLVVMELHLTHKGHREESLRLIERMHALGFKQSKAPKVGEKNWTTLATWAR